MIPTEKQLSTKATTDSFDEIYNNADISVNDTYLAETGYPFDYPTRWLNDPSMNKRIGIRRLDVLPSSHSFALKITAYPREAGGLDTEDFSGTITVSVTCRDNLIQVLSFICNSCSYKLKDENGHDTDAGGGLNFEYDNRTNDVTFWFTNSRGEDCDFSIEDATKGDIMNITSFLQFLNQDEIMPYKTILEQKNIQIKTFHNVWNRERLYFHASFSTSRRHFIGKRGDFYQNLTLLYPPPTNESTFLIRFTTNGTRNILIRYCEFDIQLCYIVNYRKATIL